MQKYVKNAPVKDAPTADNMLADVDIDKSSQRDAMSELISSRRTIHKFLPDVPSRDLILKSVEMARWAPNHKLTEPWRFYLIGEETAESIAQLNARIVEERKGPQIAKAKLAQWQAVPMMVAVTQKKCDDAFREKEDYAAVCCAIQNMSLYLWKEGVGIKWSTTKSTRHPDFYDLLAIDPEREEVVGLLWLGYPEVVPAQKRKPVGEIVRELP